VHKVPESYPYDHIWKVGMLFSEKKKTKRVSRGNRTGDLVATSIIVYMRCNHWIPDITLLLIYTIIFLNLLL
jgi:hypothetical protein